MNYLKTIPSIFAFGVACAAGPLYAVEIHQTVNDTSDDGPNMNGALWGTPAASPTAVNDYISDSTDGMTQVRTGNAGNFDTFEGGSLTLRGTSLIVKTTGVAANFILENGGEISLGESGNKPIEGTLHVATGQAGTITTSGSSDRDFTVNATISGGGTLTTDGSSTNEITIANAANTFTGSWSVDGSILIGETAGTLGLGGFVVNNGGTLDIRYTFLGGSSSGLAINTGGLFDLSNGQSYIFQSVMLDGAALAAGTYTYGDLDPAQQAYFINGADTFTVVPEPGTVTMLVGGLCFLVGSRRRRRKF